MSGEQLQYWEISRPKQRLATLHLPVHRQRCRFWSHKMHAHKKRTQPDFGSIMRPCTLSHTHREGLSPAFLAHALKGRVCFAVSLFPLPNPLGNFMLCRPAFLPLPPLPMSTTIISVARATAGASPALPGRHAVCLIG